MTRCAALCQWTATVATHLPHLSKPQAAVLALWSFGMVLARSCALTAVAGMLAGVCEQKENTLVNSGIILTQIQRLKIDPPPGILVYPDGNQVSPSGGGDARGGTMGRNPSSASH